jgi:FkbM family methyltransferase
MGGSPVALDPVILPLIQGPKILDVGCGFGKWGYLCTSNYWQTFRSTQGSRPEIVGCDGYQPNVQMCRNNGCYKEVLQLVVPPLPFDDCSFDSVLLIEIVEHLEEERAQLLIREAKRVARHRVIISTPNYPCLRGGTNSITGWNALDAHLSYISRAKLKELGFRLFGCGLQPGPGYFRYILRRLGMLGWYDDCFKNSCGGLSLLFPAAADNVVGLWTREASPSCSQGLTLRSAVRSYASSESRLKSSIPAPGSFKQVLKQVTPPIVWNAGRQFHHLCLGTPPGDSRQDSLERTYRASNAGLDADAILLRPGVILRIHPESRQAFEQFCYISPPMVSEMNMFLKLVKERQRLLDIGALYGIFSLVFASLSPDKKALAVDASPIAFARLLYNVHRNDFSNVRTIECAVSDKVGTLAMHYEQEQVVAAGTDRGSNIISIQTKTGDALCCSENFRPDVIKIDVEGHEIKVLKGLAETIKETLPLIFLEVHPRRILEEGDSLRFLASFFDELDYTAQFNSGEPFQLSRFQDLQSTERLFLSKKTAHDFEAAGQRNVVEQLPEILPEARRTQESCGV